MARPVISPEQRAKMRSHVRDAVLRIARRRNLAAGDTKGWNGITIRDVIKEADISIGTFYKYFEDRSDLAQTMWQEPVAELRAEMQAAFDAVPDPAAKVRAVLERYAAFAIENHRLFKNAFLFVRPEGQDTPESQPLDEEVFFKCLYAAFESGQESGQFREFDRRDMAQIFWAAVHGSLALPVNIDRYQFDAQQELARKMIDELLRVVARA